VDLKRIKEKKELFNEIPMSMNKYFLTQSLPDNNSEDLFKLKFKPNELSTEDKQNLISMKLNAVPSNRQDVINT